MRRTLEERFWSKVRKTDGCWLWTGGKNSNGYGYFAVTHNWIVRAHRIAFELTVGPVPANLHVLHRCDVCACVNPAHLFLGTHQDNMTDKIRKGRSPTALSLAQARAVRDRCARGEKQSVVAIHFGVSPTTISGIVNGRLKSYAR